MKKSLLLVLSVTLSLFALGQTPPPVHHTVYQDCSKMGHRYDYTKGQTQDSIDYGNAPANVEAVDLGLPSGTRWANMNVGATTPEGYGNYYAWGETTTKSTYDWSTYKYCNGTYNTMTKYCNSSSYGTVDNKTVLEPADDAAHVNWGGSWRMPTHEEQQELLDNCTSTWTTQKGVYGYLLTSKKNGKTLFLPAAGYRNDSSLYNAGSNGYYWSASLGTSYANGAWLLYFNSGGLNTGDSIYRYYGFAIRPVCAH